MRSNIFVLLLALCSTSVWAQKLNGPDSYNYTRGIESIQRNDGMKLFLNLTM